MSNQFEQRIAAELINQFEENPPREGQVFTAGFHTEGIVEGVVSELRTNKSTSTNTISYGNDDFELIAYQGGEVPLNILSVKSDTDAKEINESGTKANIEVTQGFATTMRDLVADSVGSDNAQAVLMILERDLSIDTLQASTEIFEDSLLDLEEFASSVLTPDEESPEYAIAILNGLRRVIKNELDDITNVQTLETLCAIRSAVDADSTDKLPDLIAELPNFIWEYYLSEDRYQSLENAEYVEEILYRNHEHGERLFRARRPSRNLERELTGQYKEEFISKVQKADDINNISSHEAKKKTIKKQKRELKRVKVFETANYKEYAPPDEASFSNASQRRSIITVPQDNTVKIQSRFIGEMSGVPWAIIDSDGNKTSSEGHDDADIGSVSRRKNILTATIEPTNTDQINFANFQIFVGKKTTGGYPTHEFSIAVVPEEIYGLFEGENIDIDVVNESFVSHGDSPVTFGSLDPGVDPSKKRVADSKSEISLSPPHKIVPDPVEIAQRIQLNINFSNYQFKFKFETDVSTAEVVDIRFPLILTAISNPEDWSTDGLHPPEKLSVDTDRGEIQVEGSEANGLSDNVQQLLTIEEAIRDSSDPTQRVINTDSLQLGTTNSESLPHNLEEAYDELFEILANKSLTPSTARWEDDVVAAAETVLEAFVEAVRTEKSGSTFAPFESLREVGTIRSTVTDKVWLTPYHPIMLAYALRIVKWRDELIDDGITDGFKKPDAARKFNPTGLLPYRLQYRSKDELLRGITKDGMSLWATYSPISLPGSETPDFVDRVVSNQGTSFLEAFSPLFEVHDARKLELNLINMGDLEELIEGLFRVFGVLKARNKSYPEILLRIYGDSSQGEALSQFFQEDGESSLYERLKRDDENRVNSLRSKITYTREGEYSPGELKEAHITFFRGLLNSDSGVHAIDDLPSRLLNRGLMPRESIRTDPTGDAVSYTVGYGSSEATEDLLTTVANCSNALESGYRNDSQPGNQALKKTITSKRTELNTLWENSLWVIHIRPSVGLDFYLRTNEQSDPDEDEESEMTIIHHSDQYDSSSPNYDVVTSTQQKQPYLKSLESVLQKKDLGDGLSPETILTNLVAIDGQLALDLQRPDQESLSEAIGLIGTLLFEQELLKEKQPDYVWIPVSLALIVEHDRSARFGAQSLLSYEATGPASDDLCFVGVPKDGSPVQLWLVEAKGGSSDLNTAKEQIKGARESLMDLLKPSAAYADTDILKGEFGKLVYDIANRMNCYDVLSDLEFNTIEQNQVTLLEGNYDLEFCTDAKGYEGDVVNIQSNPIASIDYKDNVRVIKIPKSQLKQITSQSLEEALPDIDLNALSFD